MLFNYLQRVLISFHWSWRDISHSAYLETPNVGTLCIRDSEREVRLWRDLIEFWVYGVWFAKLLIKHPRRGSRHTGTQITHQLCLTNRFLFLFLLIFPSPFFLLPLALPSQPRVSRPLPVFFALASADWYLSLSLTHPWFPPSTTLIHVLRGR